jgi:hypothetical protein
MSTWQVVLVLWLLGVPGVVLAAGAARRASNRRKRLAHDRGEGSATALHPPSGEAPADEPPAAKRRSGHRKRARGHAPRSSR